MPLPFSGFICSVSMWQLADSEINDVIFIHVLQKLTALDFALRLDQIQQSHYHLRCSNKDLIQLKSMKLMVTNYSFCQEDFKGSAEVLMALEGKLQ